jgi:putative tryptophan/tyrosine transport system substrate-binding protein
MRRREFVTLVGGAAAAWPLAALAKQPKQFYQIGFLGGFANNPYDDAFVDGLRQYGYVVGQNLSIERKAADQQQLIPRLVADIVQQNVDVIVANSNAWGLAAKKATSTIPIVVLTSHGGVDVGLYESLAHPGGNVTGIDSLAESLDAKRIDIFKQFLPQLSRLVILYNPGFPGADAHLASINAATRKFGLATRLVELGARSEVEKAFNDILADRPDAVLLVSDPIIAYFTKQIADFGNTNKLPIATEYRFYAEFGMCLSYGPNLLTLFRRAAYYVDRILKGAEPGDLPVELPTAFELVINLKTAKALGLSVPDSLLATADLVIE